jgi:NAD(P)H-quinone oxidoreductase subunit 5
MIFLSLLQVTISRYEWLFPSLTPLPLLVALFFPRKIVNKRGLFAGHTVILLALVSLLLALLACVASVLNTAPIHRDFISWGVLSLSIYFDTVSAIMLLLVSFLALSVASFSRNYLDGNPEQGYFFKWLSITAGSVLLLVVSGNLALFALAWAAVSLSLHQLLIFYRHRYGAVTAARKKYLFSRCGDMALIGALLTIWYEFGTFDYSKLFVVVSQGAAHSLALVNVLLVIAALIKSAQFPFHGWLPETMEMPTPVSALMHAGIINAGGFLIIRLSPLIVCTPGALELLAAVGGFTALFGSLVMITQTSVKRSLAFSTIAQMGFMMLQCGLGAFSLALFHIVAHSLYKAHAFLSSGRTIDQARLAGESLEKKYLGIYGACAALVTALLSVCSVAFMMHVVFWENAALCCFTLILTIALAQLLWHWWSLSRKRKALLEVFVVVCLLSLLFFLLHAGIESLVEKCIPDAPAFRMAWPIAIITLLSFLMLALRVFLPPSWVSTRIGSALFVHVYNGFYVHTVANRLIDSFWSRSDNKAS